MRHRLVFLLAQVGYWAGRRIGHLETRVAFPPRRINAKLYSRAKAMLRAGYTPVEVADAMDIPEEMLRRQLAQAFVTFVRQCQSEGFTHAEMAAILDISTTELRAIFSWAMGTINK